MPSHRTPSTNLSTGVSTKPTNIIPDYLSKAQNFVPLSVFFAGIPAAEADPDSLFGLQMPSREKKKAIPPKEKKTKGGTSNTKDEKKDSDNDESKKEKDSQKDKGTSSRSQVTTQPQSAQTQPAQGAKATPGAKQESRGTMYKPQKCMICKKTADKRIIWADGRAYVSVCSDHVEAGKTKLEKDNGKWAQIVAVKTVKTMNEGLAGLLDLAIQRQLVARSEMTTTANVPTLPVPIGAGDGRKFLDSPDDDKRKKKKKKRSLSRKIYMLLNQ